MNADSNQDSTQRPKDPKAQSFWHLCELRGFARRLEAQLRRKWLKFDTLDASSLFQRIPAYSKVIQPIPAYLSIKKFPHKFDGRAEFNLRLTRELKRGKSSLTQNKLLMAT